MAILVFIVFGIYQAVTQTFKLRTSLAAEGNFYNSLRLSTTIIQRDLALMYSPTAMAPAALKPPNPGSPEARSGSSTSFGNDNVGQTSPFWLGGDQSGLRLSHFIGTDRKISFISMSHIRIYKDTPESEFAKITYEIVPDTHDPENKGNFVLVKTESPNVFDVDDRDLFAKKFEILRGIKKLSFVFYQWERDRWKPSRNWDNEKEEFRNIYPDVIEMQIELVGPDRLSFEGKFKFKPEFPFYGFPARI